MRSIFYMLFTMISLLSCAQKKSTRIKAAANNSSVVKNSYAYISVRFAGTIAVDASGNPRTRGVDTSYIIYVETPANADVTWEKAFVNNNAFSVAATAVTVPSTQVGYAKSTNKPIVLKAAEGHRLWQLTLQQPLGDEATNKASEGSLQVRTAISVQGVYNKKKVCAYNSKHN